MLRKPALLLASLFVLPFVANARPPERIETHPCGADAAKARPLLDSLATDYPETRGAMLVVDGCIAYKAYAGGFADNSRMISWSMAKTITAMLVGQLVADGRLQLDAPAPIAEWHGANDPRRAITLRHLLNMASGLRHIEVGKSVAKSDTNQILFVSGPAHMAADAIAQPLVHPPGSHFEYSTTTAIILSEIITRTLTRSTDPTTRARAYRAFADQRLFRPAGVKSAFLEFDGAGTQVGGSLIYMTMPDWVRMGRLLIDGRAYDGSRVIAPQWLAFLKTPSPANHGYGGQLWLNLPGDGAHGPGLFDHKGPRDAVGMKGHLGQYVVGAHGKGRDGKVHDIVLVRLGHTDEDKLQPIVSRMGDVVQAIIPAGSAHR